MSNLLNPYRFDSNPKSLKKAKLLKHWLKPFTDFLEKMQGAATTKEVGALNRLQPCVCYEC